jgi:hypothetical protein
LRRGQLGNTEDATLEGQANLIIHGETFKAKPNKDKDR